MKSLGILMVGVLAGLGVVAMLGGSLAPVTLWLDGLTMGRNTAPPAYLREVVAYKEGNGFRLYLTLADAQGRLTRSAGIVELRIRDTKTLVGYQRRTVQAEDFEVTKVGQGAWTRTTVLLDLGRLTDKDLQYPRESAWLTIEITFSYGREALTGSTTVGL